MMGPSAELNVEILFSLFPGEVWVMPVGAERREKEILCRREVPVKMLFFPVLDGDGFCD